MKFLGIVRAAITVHSALGPGLLESAYRACLCHELSKRGLQSDVEVVVPLKYDGVTIDVGYRLDLLVEDAVIVELKTVRSCCRFIGHSSSRTYD
jgi:GxxExxY protein